MVSIIPFFLEPKTPATPPIEIIDNLLKGVEDMQHDTAKPAAVEITGSEMNEKNEKLIQKEGMETGSVSFILSNRIPSMDPFR